MRAISTFLTIDKEENIKPKCLELGNEVEGAGQLEKRSKILTEPEHHGQHEQLAEEVQLPQHLTDTTKEKNGGKCKKLSLRLIISLLT